MIFGYIAVGILILLALFTLNGFIFGIADTKAVEGKVDWKQARKDAFDGFFHGCLVLGVGIIAGFGLIFLFSGLSGHTLSFL